MSNSFEDKLGSVTYPSLLHMGFDEIGVTATLRPVYDGTGVETPLRISTTQMGVGDTIINSDGSFTFQQLASEPIFPASGKTIIYAKTDGKLYYENNDGVEHTVGTVRSIENENGSVSILDTTNTTETAIKLNGLEDSDTIAFSGGGDNTPISAEVIGIDFDIIDMGDSIVPMANGGVGNALSAPSEDKLLGYDFGETENTYFSLGTGLTTSGTTINGCPTDASYITLDTHSSLPNERVLTEGVNISINDEGPGSYVSISVSGIGETIQAHSPSLDSLANYDTNGFLVQTDTDTFTGRVLAAGSSKIIVTDGDGINGNPTVDLSVPIDVIDGGTGLTSTTANGLITGGTTSTSPLQNIGHGLDGQVLLGNTSGQPVFASIRPSTNISGYWYFTGSIDQAQTSTTAASAGTGTLWFFPLFVTSTTTYTKIGRFNGATANGNTVFGIYNNSSNNQGPTGSPIANSTSGSIANSSNTFISYTFSSPITLTPGIYWPAFSLSGTNTVGIRNTQTSVGFGWNATPSSAGLASIISYKQSFTYSETLPVVGSLLLGYTTNDVENSFLWLQVQ